MAELDGERFLREIADPKSGIKSVEDVLCRLPKEFRKNFLLGFDSKSVQGSSYKNPRVIMYDRGTPPKLVITFNGDPEQEGYNRIEVMTPAKKNDNGDVIELTDIDFSKPQEKRIHSNPENCRGCHSSSDGSPLRPLFNALPVWPGYYGNTAVPGLIPRSQIDEQEKEFEKFQEAAQKNSRYRYLEDLQGTIALTAEEKLGLGYDDSRDEHFVLPERNRAFTKQMALLNRPRLAKLIKSTPHYEEYKYAILGVMALCEPASEFLPPEVQSKHMNISRLDPVFSGPMNEKKMKEVAEKFYESRLKLQPKKDFMWHLKRTISPSQLILAKFDLDTSLKQGFYGANTGANSALRYLFEAREIPVDMKAWNIDPQQGEYRFNNNSAMDFDFVELGPTFVKEDPDLAKFVKPGELNDPFGAVVAKNCNALKKKSREALAGLAKRSKQDTQSTEAKAVCLECAKVQKKDDSKNLKMLEEVSDTAAVGIFKRNCASCHDNGVKGAPKIDFSDLACSPNLRGQIRERISIDPEKEGHMPQLGTLGTDEIKILKDYLDRLKKRQPSSSCGPEADFQ
jgi:hypothetical protein